jgi:hypothetical protein
MRAALSAIGALCAVALVATASAAPSKSTLSVRFPLPAPSQASVRKLVVQVTAPKGGHVGAIRVTSPDAARLGGRKLNTQLVAAVSPKSSSAQKATFTVWLFIHRFPSVVRALSGQAGEEGTVDISQIAANAITLKVNVDMKCAQIQDAGWFEDSVLSAATVTNEVPTNDTSAEEQLDNTVHAKCGTSEAPDSGNG